jgi:hypothetical protein
MTEHSPKSGAAAGGGRRIAYGHRQHEASPRPDGGHYLQSKVRSDVWQVLQQLRQQHGLSISGAAHHLMRLGAGLAPLPPLNTHTLPHGD